MILPKQPFSLEKMYSSILIQFQYQLEKRAKCGQISPSLPDILVGKIRELMDNRELLHYQEFQPVENNEDRKKCLVGDEAERKEVKTEEDKNGVIYQQQEDDEFQFLKRAEEQRKKVSVNEYQQLKVLNSEPVKQQSKFKSQTYSEVSEMLSCTGAPAKFEAQSKAEPEYLVEYWRQQEQRENQLAQLKTLSEATIYASIQDSKVKKYVKPKGQDCVIVLNLCQMFVKQRYYPYREHLYKVRGLTAIKHSNQKLADLLGGILKKEE